MKAKIGIIISVAFIVTFISMWVFVLNQIRYERAMVDKAAHADAMNLATAFEAHGAQRDLAHGHRAAACS